MARPYMLAIMGPTASGKTDLAEALADHHRAILINADAFQIYRGMDIGTAKPQERARYQLLDIRNPDESFGVGEWVQLASTIVRDNYRQGRSTIIVGGTGLYIRALFEGYTEMLGVPDADLRVELELREREEGLEALAKELSVKAPKVAEMTDLRNPARVRRALEKLAMPSTPISIQLPDIPRLKVAITVENDILLQRISTRIQKMVQNGWILEIEGLRAAGYRPEHPGFRALGYRSFWKVMEGELGLEDAIATTIAETRRYAKRQRTWLRSEPRLEVIDMVATHDDQMGVVTEMVDRLN